MASGKALFTGQVRFKQSVPINRDKKGAFIFRHAKKTLDNKQ